MRLSVSIMAHPDRVEQVAQLDRHLGNTGIPVGWDNEGPPTRDVDRCWRTARRAWELHDPAADWHLLLQDDAIANPDLLKVAARALRYVPENAVVSFYMGTHRPVPGVWTSLARKADEAGAAWVVGPLLMWGVALAVQTRHIPQMIEKADRMPMLADDQRVGRWARRAGLEPWYSWPSLVDHPPGGSLCGHGAGRVARRFAAHGTVFDWGGPVVRYR